MATFGPIYAPAWNKTIFFFCGVTFIAIAFLIRREKRIEEEESWDRKVVWLHRH